MYVWICVNMFGRAATDWQLHFSTLQHASPYCHTLQRTATHCNTLQHTATHRNTLQHRGVRRGCNCTLDRACIHGCSPSCGSQVLHCAALCCSALQCVAVCGTMCIHRRGPSCGSQVLHCVALCCTVVHCGALSSFQVNQRLCVSRVCVYVYIYICLCVCLCVSVCVCIYASISVSVLRSFSVSASEVGWIFFFPWESLRSLVFLRHSLIKYSTSRVCTIFEFFFSYHSPS